MYYVHPQIYQRVCQIISLKLRLHTGLESAGFFFILFKKIIVSDNDVPYASELFLESEFTVVLAGNLNESKTNQKVIRKKNFYETIFCTF